MKKKQLAQVSPVSPLSYAQLGHVSKCSTMGWENRGNHRYYYRKRRVGKRVVSIYIGKGFQATFIAELDALIRQERQTQRNLIQQDLAQVAQLQEVEQLIRLLTAALLVATEHYAHKRQWRKRRGKKRDPQKVQG